MGITSTNVKKLLLTLILLQNYQHGPSSCRLLLVAEAAAPRWQSSVSSSDNLKETKLMKTADSTASSSSVRISPEKQEEEEAAMIPRSKNQDPYVAASPLSVAAVCRDGIALVSLHYNVDVVDSPSTCTINEEVENGGLSNASNSSELVEGGNNSTLVSKDNHSQSPLQNQHQQLEMLFRDLPLASRGPLRIESIYETTHHQSLSLPPPMAMLTAGWRTDGLTLADAARELMMEEVRLYCLPSLALMMDGEGKGIANGDGDDGKGHPLLEGDTNNSLIEGDANKELTENDEIIPISKDDTNMISLQKTSYHGRRIAEGLSYYLSKCAFSEGVRSLSCVALLACGNNSILDTNSLSKTSAGRSGGSLYLVDSTGTHRVRAHAIGNGSMALHKRMTCIDFEKMDCQEGLRTLLRLIGEEGGLLVEMSSPSELASGDGIGSGSRRSIMAKPAFVQNGSGNSVKVQTREEEGQQEQQSSMQSSTVMTQQQQQQNKWTIPSNNDNVAVELAVLKSGEGRMKRVRLTSLFNK